MLYKELNFIVTEVNGYFSNNDLSWFMKWFLHNTCILISYSIYNNIFSHFWLYQINSLLFHLYNIYFKIWFCKNTRTKRGSFYTFSTLGFWTTHIKTQFVKIVGHPAECCWSTGLIIWSTRYFCQFSSSNLGNFDFGNIFYSYLTYERAHRQTERISYFTFSWIHSIALRMKSFLNIIFKNNIL